MTVTDESRRWWTLGAMCFALFMIMLDNTVVNVALPSIQRGLHATTSTLEWTVNAYTLTFAVLLVTGGRLGDLFGRRKAFLFGVVVFGTSSFLIGLSSSDAWLVSFRAIQGIGAGFMMPATLSIITNTFDAHERGRAIGTWAGVSALALAIGPVVGGLLVQEVSWQSIFFLNVPVAALAVLVTLFATHESRDQTAERRVDVAGVIALTIGLACLVLALVESNSWGWGSTKVISMFAVAAVSIAVFVRIEMRERAPMLDFRFFKERTFLGANIVAFIVSFAMLAMFFFLALYMQDVLRYSPLQAGIRFLPSTVLIILLAPVAGRLADRIGSRPLMAGGLISVAASMFWLTQMTPHSSYGFIVVSFVLMGAGMAFVISPMSTAAMNSVDPTKAGVASGVLSMTRMVGGTFGVALMGAIVSTLGRSHLETLLPKAKPGQIGALVNALGSGTSGGHLPATVQVAMNDTFVYALSKGLYVAGGVSLLGAVVALTMIGKRKVAPAPQPAVEEEASAPAPIGA